VEGRGKGLDKSNAFYVQLKPNIRVISKAKKKKKSTCVSIRVIVLKKCNLRWKPYY
jgi:hypothetical protein